MSQPYRVAVWRDLWLSDTETFVRDQLVSLERWEPFLVGLRRRPNVLGVEPDLAPLPAHQARRAKVLGSLGVRRLLLDGLRRSGARLLHAHFGTSAVHALPVARAAGLPLVVTFHGHDVTSTPRAPWGMGREYRRRLRQIFAHAERLVAVSEFIAGRLLALGAPEGKVVVLPIGIDTAAARAAQVDRSGRSGVLFLGRLVPKKGVDDLLEAFALLPEDLRRSTPLRIVGGGHERERLERLAAARGLPAQFLGHVPPAEAAALLRSAQVLVAPSRTAPDGDSEGFGMVFLEAAAWGTPQVAYAHGGVPEAVLDGVTGLLAPEGDVPALAERVARLLRDRALAERLGLQGRERALREFDVRDRTSALEKLYDEVAA